MFGWTPGPSATHTVSLFRRRALPPALAPVFAAFEACLAHIEGAKELLVSSVPQARLPGRPLPEALHGFREGLVAGRGTLAAWRVQETEEAWLRCDVGLDHAIARTEVLLADPPTELGFDAHLELVQELLDPLDGFEGAEQRFRELRV